VSFYDNETVNASYNFTFSYVLHSYNMYIQDAIMNKYNVWCKCLITILQLLNNTAF